MTRRSSLKLSPRHAGASLFALVLGVAAGCGSPTKSPSPTTSGGQASGGVGVGVGGSAAGSAGMPGVTGGASSLGGSAGSAGGGAPPMVEQPPTIDVAGGTLKLEVCAEDLIRVAFAKDPAFFTRPSLMAAPKRCDGALWQATDVDLKTTITTAKLKITVDKSNGAVSFADAAGQPIVAEKAGGRVFTPATVHGEATQSARQEWEPNDGEALYGLGEHQQGFVNLKGYDLDLYQYNTNVVVPFLVSSRGYGILWDNTSFTRFGDLAEAVPLPGVTGLYATNPANPGDVAPGTGTVSWTGQVQASVTGDYQFQTFASGNVKLTVDGVVVIDHFRQGWLAATELAKVKLTAGQSYPVKLEWASDGGVNTINLRWKPPVATPSTALWSEVADGTDYYFAYGPELDHVVAGYRRITGQATMLPRTAFGLWQCRERYKTAQESLDVVKGYRSRNIPLDNIVQDWQYWEPAGWGSHAFDATRFPDPAGWIKSLHDQHAQLMISVWPKFYPDTANFTALNSKGFLYQPNLTDKLMDFVGYPFTFYDAFNPEARALYWQQMKTQLFDKGVDAWWLDASEPETVEGPHPSEAKRRNDYQTHMTPTALGSGSRMENAYPLVNSQAVYEGQRAAKADQRVFILTRSAFAGQQRYSAAIWSGDITATWTAFKKQIAAGVGYSVSGTPYWTVDSGGFAVPTKFADGANAEEWRELSTRWFEFSTFLPLLRVHGQTPNREMWEFGGETSPAYLAQLKFDRLRYRMLPYVYSLAGAVTHEAGTILRPLVMDFRTDSAALNVADQFMFGKAFLVSPVTTYLARDRSVYLPTTPGGWYDFWTGAALAGGKSVTASAAFDAMPVHVRAGSIVPFGPELMYTSEKPIDPLTIYVYAGADGAFTLYEDDGQTFAYENNAFARIPITWKDATKTLTLGAREGTFPGMLETRMVQVVLVSASKAVGFSFTPTADKTVSYTGAALDVVLP
ncbi:MAG: TIM-barrel domain-containing protein [Myxococcales bacterium]